MVYAIDIANPTTNPVAKFSTIGVFLNILLPLITIGVALMVLYMFLKGGFTFITGGDSADGVKKAQQMFIYAILGLGVVIFSYLFIKLFANILNVQLPF